MRLLFVHDHRFFRNGAGDILTSGSLPAPVWQRYLRHFGSLQVIGRDGGLAPADANYAVSSRPGVTFDLVPDASYLQLFLTPARFRDRVRGALAQCDAAVIRLPSELGFIAASECRKMGKPYAVEMVGCAWDGMRNHGSALARAYAPLFYWRARRALHKASLTLYVTSEWLQRRYPTSGFSSHASNVEIQPITTDQMAARESRLARIKSGHPVRLGTVASLQIKSKGVQTAIRALALLKAEGLPLTYSVLGPGNQAPWRALAQSEGVGDLVQFDGTRKAGDGVRAWLDEIDIHLQPSFQEGLPRATVEAMSRGAACIGSTCGGIPELLPTDRTHQPGDAEALAACVRKLATNPLLLEEASKRDLEASQDYEPDRLRIRRDEIYGRLLKIAERGTAGMHR